MSLPIYLHDHLGAANFALEMLDKWTDDTDLPGLAAWAKPLHAEINADRETLRQIIERVGEPPHSFKEKLGWLGEKLSRPKLGKGESEFAHFEALEFLALGILGKVSLWQTLEILADTHPGLVPFDYVQLLDRARHQHTTVESRRREFIPTALLPRED